MKHFLITCFLIGAPCIRAGQAELDQAAVWSVAHEGCDLYQGDVMRPMAAIRQCLQDTQRHNAAAFAEIASVNDQVLLASIERSRRAIPDIYDTRKALSWSAYHEGNIAQFRIWRAGHNFAAIRRKYQETQAHNPNAIHLMSNYSDSDIGLLLDGI